MEETTVFQSNTEPRPKNSMRNIRMSKYSCELEGSFNDNDHGGCWCQCSVGPWTELKNFTR